MSSTSGSAAIYARISLDKAGEGLGVERQIEKCRELAALHGYEVADGRVLRDDSKSAYKGVDRGGYAALLELIRSGSVERVYVYSVDRLVRRTQDLLDVVKECEPHGVTIHAFTGAGIDPTSPNGIFVSTILGAVAEQESALKASRIRAAYEQRAHSGRPKKGGRRIFGYKADGETIREDEAALLREAARLVVDEKASLRSIAAAWNAAGATSTRGNPVDTVLVRSLLKNPYLAGLSTWTPSDAQGRRRVRDRQIVAEGAWPAIIEIGLWEQLQGVLADPKRVTNKAGNTPQRLMSGLLICQCGQPMYRRTRPLKSGEGRFSYYSCKRTVAGAHVHIGSDDVDATVAALVVARLARTDLAAALAAASSEAGDDADALAEATRERTDLLARRDDLEEAVAEGGMAVAAFGRAVARVEERLVEAEVAIARLAAADSAPVLAEVASAESVEAWWGAADLMSRRRVVDDLVTVTVGPGRTGAKRFDPERLRVAWKRRL